MIAFGVFTFLLIVAMFDQSPRGPERYLDGTVLDVEYRDGIGDCTRSFTVTLDSGVYVFQHPVQGLVVGHRYGIYYADSYCANGKLQTLRVVELGAP
jgi:hypothetical protein